VESFVELGLDKCPLDLFRVQILRIGSKYILTLAYRQRRGVREAKGGEREGEGQEEEEESEEKEPLLLIRTIERGDKI